MKANHNLEHIVFNSWKKKAKIDILKNYKGRIVVGVSGGSDSMVLLNCLLQCLPKKLLVVVYCHHGDGNNKKYRDDAQGVVSQFCNKKEIEFKVIKTDRSLSSESELRSFRLSAFSAICQEVNATLVALAHHRDDWLENQIIKLIRGTSFSGLKKAFRWSWLNEYQIVLWRPLSECQRSTLEAYRIEKNIPFIEDPTNKEAKYLRNWLRIQWLPMLEAKRNGSVNRLALSLINSIQEVAVNEIAFPWNFETGSIDFLYFLSLTEAEKLRCLAFYVDFRGLKSIKSSQLKEIIRQLDNASDHAHIHFKTFECSVNAGQLIIKVN